MKATNKVRDTLIAAGVRNLKEYGYPGVTAENIFTDYVYAGFFVGMLERTADEAPQFKRQIDELIAEVNAKRVHPDDEKPKKRSKKTAGN